MPISVDIIPSQGMGGQRDRIGFLMPEEHAESWRTLMREAQGPPPSKIFADGDIAAEIDARHSLSALG